MKKVQAFFINDGPGFLLASTLALISWFLGQVFPLFGGTIFALLLGLCLSLIWKDKGRYASGLLFSSKKAIQYAVICLGFGLDMGLVFETGRQVFPLLMMTVIGTLCVAGLCGKFLPISSELTILIGVGTAICGGSAIAATAPVIEAEDEDLAQSIAVIFLFNLLAALLFPSLGNWLGFSADTGESFGIFAGTAVNDTSSVTATATVWDQMYHLGSQTLDKAVTVKLTRTLAILPITFGLALLKGKKGRTTVSRNIFPIFILYFLMASFVTTTVKGLGFSTSYFHVFKLLSRFLIMTAMGAIGLNADMGKLLRSGRSALMLGFLCWVFLVGLTLVLQSWLGFW